MMISSIMSQLTFLACNISVKNLCLSCFVSKKGYFDVVGVILFHKLAVICLQFFTSLCSFSWPDVQSEWKHRWKSAPRISTSHQQHQEAN